MFAARHEVGEMRRQVGGLAHGGLNGASEFGGVGGRQGDHRGRGIPSQRLAGGVKTDRQTAIGGKQGALTGSVFSEVPVVTVEMLVAVQSVGA